MQFIFISVKCPIFSTVLHNKVLVFNRPGVVGAVLKTPLWLTQSVSHHFPPNLQNMINPKPQELGGWNLERILNPHNMSLVTCHVSHVTCHLSRFTFRMSHLTCNFFFRQRCGAYRWKVCYQQGLPRLVVSKSLACGGVQALIKLLVSTIWRPNLHWYFQNKP